MLDFFKRSTDLYNRYCQEEFGDFKIEVLSQIVSTVFMNGGENVSFLRVSFPVDRIPYDHFNLLKLTKEILEDLEIDLSDLETSGGYSTNVSYLRPTSNYIYMDFMKQ